MIEKKALEDLGIAKEQVEKVVELFKSTLDGKYIPKERFDVVNEELKSAKKTIDDRDKQIESLKSVNVDELKLKIEELQTLNKNTEEQYTAQINKMKIDNAVTETLRKYGAIDPATVIPILDLKDARLDDYGKVLGLDEKIESLKNAKTHDFLFASDSKKEEDAPTNVRGFEPRKSGYDPVSPDEGLSRRDLLSQIYK